MTHAVYTVRGENGEVAVVADAKRFAEMVSQAKGRAVHMPPDEAKVYVEAVEAAAQRGIALWESVAGVVTEESYEVRPYTYGEKRLARARHSGRDERGVPWTDEEAVVAELVPKCLGMSPDEFDALPVQVAEELVRAVVAVSEPDAGRLAFLGSTPPGSGKAL